MRRKSKKRRGDIGKYVSFNPPEKVYHFKLNI